MRKGRKLKEPDEKLARLVARLEERIKQKGMSIPEACQRAGLGRTYIRDIKTRNYSPSIDKLERLVKVLDWTVAQAMDEDGTEPHRNSGLLVLYAAQVGQYRDVTLSDPNETKPRIGVGTDGRFPAARQYAVHTLDDSMDREGLPAGSYATCVDLAESGLELKAGMIVHVEKTAPGTNLVETSLKKIIVDQDAFRLVPCSSNRRFGSIDMRDSTVEVRGVVIGRFTPVKL